MFKGLKRLLIGRPLKNEVADEEKYSVFGGLPILASDALSSVAYATEEILLVLTPAIGLLAFPYLNYISIAIISLVLILAISYSQTIKSYPNGGGAYIVAKENIGVIAGVAAGAALSLDYILTVSVSISSGVAQIVSVFSDLAPYKVPLCVVIVLLLMVGNLRGLRESAKLFSFPAYAFMFAMFSMIICGIAKIKSGYTPVSHPIDTGTQAVSMFLLLKAFSNGCAALTGIEAVSNAVPNFKSPSTKNARKVMVILGFLIVCFFGGTSLLANLYHVVPITEIHHEKTVLVGIAEQVFTGNLKFMFYFLLAATFTILALAANTAFSGFPLLISIMAKEGYAPRQLSMRGDRLSYSNGIIVLSSLSILLIVVFKAEVSALIGLYSIGVFISFTLSQSGMFLKWVRNRNKNWMFKAFINGLGALVTFVAVIVIAIVKFDQKAWVVVIVIPILIFGMLKVKKHYTAVSKQLRIPTEELTQIDINASLYTNRVIVPIESVNKASIRALRYARTISENVVAFNVSIDEETGNKVKERFALIKTDIPLIVKYSPFRKVVEPLLKFIESTEYDYQKGDMVTVILPEFSVKSAWQELLHNQTRLFIQNELMKHKHIVVSTMPLQLKDDDYVMKSPKYKI
ncbi:MAG: APC family permease [Bacillota bacterium]|nr:APC family permease [Bacillota bacterium]